VEKVLFVMVAAPARHDRAASGDDTGDTALSQGDKVLEDTGMDGEIVDTLLGLGDDGFAVDVPAKPADIAAHLLKGFIKGHGTDGDRRIAQYPLARLGNIIAGGKVHQCVGSPARGPNQLLHLFMNA